MAQVMRIKSWNMGTFRSIRSEGAVRGLVDSHASAIADRANAMAKRGQYRYSGRMRRSRYGAIVFTDDYQARIDNAKRNTLLKAVGS